MSFQKCGRLGKNILLLDAAGCDITLTVIGTTQHIATEGYPIGYMRNQNCEFNFVALSGNRIIVLFEDFDLEEGYDFLHFRELCRHTQSN